MNLRKNNGFSGIDVSIAILIILIFIPTAFGVAYNLTSYRAKVERISTSINLAVEIIEQAKGSAILNEDIDNVEKFINEEYKLVDSGEDNHYTTTINKNNTTYKVDVSYENPTQYNKNDINTHLMKKMTVKVTCPIGKGTKEIEISHLLKKN